MPPPSGVSILHPSRAGGPVSPTVLSPPRVKNTWSHERRVYSLPPEMTASRLLIHGLDLPDFKTTSVCFIQLFPSLFLGFRMIVRWIRAVCTAVVVSFGVGILYGLRDCGNAICSVGSCVEDAAMDRLEPVSRCTWASVCWVCAWQCSRFLLYY